MKKKDHKELAEYWVHRMGHRIPLLKRMAFIFGNFEPDINYLTYLHGFTHYRNFLGHHFDHVFPVLLNLIDRYESSLFSVTAYYRLGKCFHYTADIFTYPHNPCFPGSMKEHVCYEMQLHDCVLAAIGKNEETDGSPEEGKIRRLDAGEEAKKKYQGEPGEIRRLDAGEKAKKKYQDEQGVIHKLDACERTQEKYQELADEKRALFNELHRRMFGGVLTADDIREALTKMHEKYMAEDHSCEMDLWYILNATQLLAEAYLYTEEERTERINLDEPLVLPPVEPVLFTAVFEQSR